MSLPQRPRVAIVVPTRDPAAHPAAGALEIARATTAHLGADVRPVVASGAGFRFSRSVNRGFDEAPDADAWVLLNDDAFMDEGWLDAMLAAAREPGVGLVGAVLRFPDGKLQHAGGLIPVTAGEYLRAATRLRAPLWALRSLARRRFARYPYMWYHHDRVDPAHRLDFLTAACLLVTRGCLERVGRFDEAYEMGCEDVDYCLRALDAGLELALATRATGVHLEGASRSPSERTLRSQAVFRERWSGARIHEVTRRGGRRGVYSGLA
ncbi:MAG TPA: glycosyltransferase [Candidatus Thermoplasmatota archaeon]|nr:glycosyltransferase [Candidatus Thermoplasmatota archaeon]